MSARTAVPARFWVLWMALLGLALVVFYGILTPFWMAVRAVAWLSEHPILRGRERPSAEPDT